MPDTNTTTITLPPGMDANQFQEALKLAISHRLVVPVEQQSNILDGVRLSSTILGDIFTGKAATSLLPQGVRGIAEGIEAIVKARIASRPKRGESAFRPQRDGLSLTLRSLALAKEAHPGLLLAVEVNPQQLREQADELDALQATGQRLTRTLEEVNEKQRNSEGYAWDLVSEHWPVLSALIDRNPRLLDTLAPVVKYMTDRFNKAAQTRKENQDRDADKLESLKATATEEAQVKLAEDVVRTILDETTGTPKTGETTPSTEKPPQDRRKKRRPQPVH